MKPVFERVPVAFERGMVGPEKTTMENFSHYYNPPSHFYQPAIKKKALEKNHRFWRNLLELENVSATVTATPIKCKIVCITFNWVWNVKKKGSQRSWSKNAILRGRNGRKRIVLFLEGKLASRRTAGLSNLHRSRVRGDNTSIRQPSTRSPLSALFLGSPFW